MSNNNKNLSRRERAKMRDNNREEKSVLNFSNNSSLQVDFFQSLLQSFSTDEKVVELIGRNAVLATSLDLVSTIVSSLDLNLYRRQKTGDFVPVRGVRHIDHQLSKPNQANTKTTFIYDIAQIMLSFGHCYIVKAADKYFVFQPREITEEIKDGVITAYKINTMDKAIDPKNVLHIFKPSINRRSYSSPIKNAIAEVLLNSEIIKQVTNHVKSGMMAKGVLKQDIAFQGALSQNMMDALSKQFTQATSGERASGTILLPKGINYEAFAQTIADSSLTEVYGLTRKTIIQSFKIPESIYTAEATSFASANVQEVAFLKNAIKPLCILIQDAFNGWAALTSETEYFQFEMGDLISQEQEKMKAETNKIKADTAVVLNQLRVYSPNEIRETSGFSKITDDSGALVDSADDNPFNAPADVVEPAVETPVLEDNPDNAIKGLI